MSFVLGEPTRLGRHIACLGGNATRPFGQLIMHGRDVLLRLRQRRGQLSGSPYEGIDVAPLDLLTHVLALPLPAVVTPPARHRKEQP
jgi:hypothetical protein